MTKVSNEEQNNNANVLLGEGFKQVFELEGEKRLVHLKVGSTIIHPEGFQPTIAEIKAGGNLIVEDSGGVYEIHKSEIGCVLDDFYAGQPV